MIEWEIYNGDDELKEEIKWIKSNFDERYEFLRKVHEKNWTRELILSENSPEQKIYYAMTKSFEEVKERFPLSAKHRCGSCEKYVDKWIDGYCGYNESFSLCKECIDKLKQMADKL